ncbi:MAG: UbiA family prenyltransferase [Bacteriovoracaceae bacterium]
MIQIQKWNTYIKERSPLPALFIISAAAAITPLAMLHTFDLKVLIGSLIFTTLMLIQMRLGDEIKDFEKDKIIHPERPLPRGLLSIKEVTQALYAIFFLTLIVGTAIAFSISMIGGISLALTSLFAWLMYKEFFIGHALAKEPMTYALTHQVIVFPLYAWVALTFDPTLFNNTLFQGWLLASFGASFTFEICRKLDPNAHSLAATYAHHYGRPLTVFFVCLFLALAYYGSLTGGFLSWSGPILVLVFLSLLAFLAKPKLYKAVEGTSVLLSLIIMWAPTFQWLASLWGKK